MTPKKSSFELHLDKLRVEYRAQLPSKLEMIEKDWFAFAHSWQPDLLISLHRDIHSLIGTSGTFGFTELSKAARALENLLKPILANNHQNFKLTRSEEQAIGSSITGLKMFVKDQLSEKPVANINEIKDFSQLNQQLTQVRNSGLVAQDISIYYLDTETESPDLLLQNLLSYGFKSVHFRSMEKLAAAVQHKQPSLIILDLHMPEGCVESFFEFARSFVERGIKVFIFSGKDDFMSRLHSVRAGIHSYVTKPAEIPSLVGMIRNHLDLNINKPTHILIVDDQASIAQFYATILEQAGMQVTTETNPYEVLHILQSSMPDLLLLDLNMPDVNGDELAAVIRQQEQLQTIPILFLSADAHPDKKTDLLEIGSDDLLSKDMPPEDLVRHVRSRVDRAKILTAMMYQDSLTGLLNHAQIQLAAERVFLQSKRNAAMFTIAMIDIDKFKSVNDSYGHLTGDRVIKALAHLFQQRLRITDYIGRFGGEEFLMVMPDINIHDAAKLINSLREAFSMINFKEGETSFNVTFSAGIAGNTGMASFMEQIKFADEALYRAKEEGRNRVCAGREFNS